MTSSPNRFRPFYHRYTLTLMHGITTWTVRVEWGERCRQWTWGKR